MNDRSPSRNHERLVLPAGEARQRLRRITRRSALFGVGAALLGAGGYEWVTRSADVDNLPGPQRRVLSWNGELAERYLAADHRMPEYPPSQVGGVKPNGDYGLHDDVSAERWVVSVQMGEDGPKQQVPIAAIYQMPRTEVTTRFCCIEGWSGIAHWAGTSFLDFSRQLFPHQERFPRYVYMATADEEYYVGLDWKSASHPQTLLAYEQNGKTLETRGGAPLRLAIPVKYGIKNIKQVATVRYTDRRPNDYWAEEGYDWFAGL